MIDKIEKIFSLVPVFLRNVYLKVKYPRALKYSSVGRLPLSTRIHISDGGSIRIGKHVSARRNVDISANGGRISVGKDCFFNSGCMIVSHDDIVIGDGCSFGPNVMVYDHDHDYRTQGGINSGRFKTTPVRIGNNVWLGANVIILRGAVIGDNAVIAAGTIVGKNSNIPGDALFYEERNNKVRKYERQ